MKENKVIYNTQAIAKSKAVKQKESVAKASVALATQQKRFKEADAQWKSFKEGAVSQYCEYKGIPIFNGVRCVGSETLLPIIQQFKS